jgi:hypothetical protein
MNQLLHSNGKPDLAHNTEAKPTADHETTREPEIGGRDGPEPTRFGDWEKNGRCIDF